MSIFAGSSEVAPRTVRPHGASGSLLQLLVGRGTKAPSAWPQHCLGSRDHLACGQGFYGVQTKPSVGVKTVMCAGLYCIQIGLGVRDPPVRT